MHKSIYRLRGAIAFGNQLLPGELHPHYFGSRYSAELVGGELYGDYKVTAVCFCYLYRKQINKRFNARQFDRRFLFMLYGGLYRYLQDRFHERHGNQA